MCGDGDESSRLFCLSLQRLEACPSTDLDTGVCFVFWSRWTGACEAEAVGSRSCWRGGSDDGPCTRIPHVSFPRDHRVYRVTFIRATITFRICIAISHTAKADLVRSHACQSDHLSRSYRARRAQASQTYRTLGRLRTIAAVEVSRDGPQLEAVRCARRVVIDAHTDSQERPG